MAVKIASKSILIHATPAVVWEYLYLVTHWKKWMSSVQEVRLLESPKRDALGTVIFSKRSRSRLLIHELEDRKVMRWSVEQHWSELRQAYHLIEDSEGTILAAEIESSGVFERQTGFWFRRRITRETEQSLSRLKELAEATPAGAASETSLSRQG